MEFPQTYVDGFHDKGLVRKMKYRKFGNTGMSVSVLSMGCSCLGYGTYTAPNEAEAVQTVRAAIKSGINYLDVAPWYGFGSCELVLGKALVGIPRKAYYIATKVGRYRAEYKHMFDFSAAKTLWSVEESLRKLQIDYIDVIQVHDVEYADSLDIILSETLPTLQKLKEAGKVRFIGITACPPNLLRELYDRSPVRIDSVLSHCHCSLLNTEFNQHVDYYTGKGTASVNAGVFAMGLFTETGPMDWHPAQDEIKQAAVKAVEYCKTINLNIASIASKFSFRTFKGATNLIGFATLDLLHTNLELFYADMNDEEEQGLEQVMNKYMHPLKVNDWSDRAVQGYRAEYKAAVNQEKSK